MLDVERRFARGLLLAAVCVIALGDRLSAADAPSRPNIVLIIADDLGIGEPGAYGGILPTPHLDALARSGVRFTSAYVTAPFCAASRAALLSGRYQQRFGFEYNPIGAANADPEIGLPPYQKTLADLLRDVGYATALVGKWHLGGAAPFHPQRRGFDEFFGFLHEGHYYVPPPYEGHITWLRRKALPDGSKGLWKSPDGKTWWTTHMRSAEPIYDADNPILRSSQPVAEYSNLTDAFTREAQSFIERKQAQPFFLCLAYNAVHSPMQAPEADLEKFKDIENIHRRLFAAMLSQLDDGIGKVLKTLADCKLDERTIVMFLSDNGGPTRELTSSNWPYRGEKGELTEGGIRIPMLVRWPGVAQAGRIEDRLVSSMDLFTTAATAAGVPRSIEWDGIDLAPFLKDDFASPIHQNLFWRVGQQAAYRSGDWKIHCRTAVDRRGNWELFNLKDDPFESKNVAAQNTEKLERLESEFTMLNRKMILPLWGPSGQRWQSDEDREAGRAF